MLESFASWVSERSTIAEPDRGTHARRRHVRLAVIRGGAWSGTPFAAQLPSPRCWRWCRSRAPASTNSRWQLPAGFPEPAVPADNPMSAAKVALGEKLFADPRLSITGQHSCQSCHSPGARVHRRLRAFARRHRRGAAAQCTDAAQCRLQRVARLARCRACARSSSRCAGRCSTSIRASSGWQGARRASNARSRPTRRMARSFRRGVSRRAAPVTMDNVIRAIAAYERTLLRGRTPLRPLRFRRRSRGAQRTAEGRHAAVLLASAPAAPAATAASISPAPGWIATIPRPNADIRRHRHGRGGARADAAQSPGDRALHA